MPTAPPPDEIPLVRLHSECLAGDVLGSQRCDCRPQLREAIERLSPAGTMTDLDVAPLVRRLPARRALPPMRIRLGRTLAWPGSPGSP